MPDGIDRLVLLRPRPASLRAILGSERWRCLIVSLVLSPREQQILEIILEGTDTEAAIGEQLAISNRTVHTYMERLYRKVGVSSRSQLLGKVFVAYATATKDDTRRS